MVKTPGLWYSCRFHFLAAKPRTEPGQQTATEHLDIGVDDLAAAVEWAVSCGARLADFQPQEDVRVMFDPDGHPFCLFLRGNPSIPES